MRTNTKGKGDYSYRLRVNGQLDDKDYTGRFESHEKAEIFYNEKYLKIVKNSKRNRKQKVVSDGTQA